ncbi:hypothetical protein [Flavobacterium reichenbachii]|uniref:Uncharacterized protein n=1 Tax=Flavobacterium reichenbachii TaxID=362418 RepID=A0A085ZNW4_9FLAO|nr:hypothetical protein [Flavobacterium reichenbachii]KFF06128.1 hypothetical protein IW19_11570 [Flavobacterium reichenbachii]OXB17648.1 hypothetical protein B0A68_04995 [Flavobacterium reichenbachii]
MKKLIIGLFFLPFNVGQSQNLEVKDLKNIINKNIPEWTASFENFDWNDFIKVDSIADFENGLGENFKNLKKFQTVYDPIISYSESKNNFIDIYSYQLNLEKKNGEYYSNNDVGQAVYLCRINDKFWERIAYNEYSKNFDDILWVNENKFLLVGYKKNENDKNSPIIYIGNQKNKSFEIVINTNLKCFEKGNFYKSKKLEKIKIKN